MFFPKKKCPKCDSKNIKVVKPGGLLRLLGFTYFQDLFSRPKRLNVCRDCGFSWEDR